MLVNWRRHRRGGYSRPPVRLAVLALLVTSGPGMTPPGHRPSSGKTRLYCDKCQTYVPATPLGGGLYKCGAVGTHRIRGPSHG